MGSQVLRRQHRLEPEVLPLPAETSREAAPGSHQGRTPKRAWAETSREAAKCCACSIKGGPETRSGTVQSLKCCPCQQKRAARLPSPEPEVLPLPAETSREAAKCCAWQHRGEGPETRSGTVHEVLPKSAAPGSIKAGGPETRSGTVQSLKCCPCQQKPGAAPGSIKRGPRNALDYRPEPEVLPLPAETSREARKCCGPETRSGTVQSLKCCPCQQKRAAQVLRLAASRGGPRNALGHCPEPEVLPLPAETSREARKCCIEGGPRNALGHRPEPDARLESAAPGSIEGGGPPRPPSRA